MNAEKMQTTFIRHLFFLESFKTTAKKKCHQNQSKRIVCSDFNDIFSVVSDDTKYSKFTTVMYLGYKAYNYAGTLNKGTSNKGTYKVGAIKRGYVFMHRRATVPIVQTIRYASPVCISCIPPVYTYIMWTDILYVHSISVCMIYAKTIFLFPFKLNGI